MIYYLYGLNDNSKKGSWKHDIQLRKVPPLVLCCVPIKLYEIAQSAQNSENRVKMVPFARSLGYLHNGLYKDPHLPNIIRWGNPVNSSIAIWKKGNTGSISMFILTIKRTPFFIHIVTGNLYIHCPPNPVTYAEEPLDINCFNISIELQNLDAVCTCLFTLWQISRVDFNHMVQSLI